MRVYRQPADPKSWSESSTSAAQPGSRLGVSVGGADVPTAKRVGQYDKSKHDLTRVSPLKIHAERGTSVVVGIAGLLFYHLV